MAKAKKKDGEAMREKAEVPIGIRIPASLARRIETVRAAYQREAPPGMEITASDTIRALLLSAVSMHEREIARRAKAAEQQARAAQRAESGQEAGA